MSDRNRWQQSAARESLHSKSPPYGRTSTQSGYGGRPTHGRSSNQIQLSPVREAPAQRLSNMAVINPPAINSSNRKRRYFHRGLLELYGFYKKFKILKVGNSNVILVAILHHPNHVVTFVAKISTLISDWFVANL